VLLIGRQNHDQSQSKESEIEKAEIEIHEGDDLYREIRVENVVKDQDSGEEAHLKPGAEVDAIVEADSSAAMKKPENT
jgi:hypothetical protein